MSVNSFAGAIRAANERRPANMPEEPVATEPVEAERPAPYRRTVSRPVENPEKIAWAVMLFMGGLLIPWIIPIAGMNLFVYRIILLLTLVPCLVLWMRGRAGTIRLIDLAVIGFSLWSALSLMVIHGVSGGLQSGGILIVETAGPYFLARVFIRSAEQFRGMIKLAAFGVFLLLPFALIEWVTGVNVLLKVFGMVFPTIELTTMPRSGFFRVQGPFDHSIIFGVNCASILALSFLTLRQGPMRKFFTTGGVGFTAFLSISSAPIGSLVFQIALLGWNRIFRAYPLRWMFVLGIVFAGYLVVELGSNQTPIQFYITHFTFDQQTGWYRLLIWENGSASVLAHPLFGIGFNDWVRPEWMHSDSVDNFWLLIAMRHGLPSLLLLTLAIMSLVLGLIFKKGLNKELGDYRIGILMCLAVYVFVGSTVHLWNAAYAWFFFLLGSGVWLLDVKPVAESEAEPEESGRRNRGRAHTRSREPVGRRRR